FPEDEELQKLAQQESLYPTISVRAVDENRVEIPAEVYLREVNASTSGVGPKRHLGHTPLVNEHVLPGYYRVVVIFEGGGFRELICNPGPAFMDVALVAQSREAEEGITQRMIRFEGSAYTFADFVGAPSYQDKTVELEAFWLDMTEVSNADYLAFAQATGHAL